MTATLDINVAYLYDLWSPTLSDHRPIVPFEACNELTHRCALWTSPEAYRLARKLAGRAPLRRRLVDGYYHPLDVFPKPPRFDKARRTLEKALTQAGLAYVDVVLRGRSAGMRARVWGPPVDERDLPIALTDFPIEYTIEPNGERVWTVTVGRTSTPFVANLHVAAVGPLWYVLRFSRAAAPSLTSALITMQSDFLLPDNRARAA